MGTSILARKLAAAALVVTAGVAAGADGAHATPGAQRVGPALEFLGQAIVPTGTMFEGTVVGGLSSMAYDEDAEVYYAISDDQVGARYYTLQIDVADGTLADGDVEFVDVMTLLAPGGSPYEASSLDPEGLTLTADGDLIITSEGFAARAIPPFIRRYALDGTYISDFVVPTPFLPSDPSVGVRQNLGFEAAAVTRSGRNLFVGTEGALVQDGPAATIANGSPARILRYDLARPRADRQLERQFVYHDDPVAEPPVPDTNFSVNGLVELLPFSDQFLLSMERSFSVGAPGTGNTIKIYGVQLGSATNVNGADSLSEIKRIRPAKKTLLLDLRTLGIPLDNVEGMTLGPRLPDGRRSLILVSDNNFAATQFTQFLLFALD